MGDKDLKLSVTLSAKDAMSKQADVAFKKMTKTAIDASTGMIKANSKVMASQQRLFQDRERLGIRSEQRIQRELKVTEAAYNRLMRSGNLSMQEQTRATEAMRSKVQQLNNEMGKLSKMQRVMAGGRFLAGGVAGATVAGMVVKPAVDKAMSYDLRLANMANTAYAGQSLNSRRSGKSTLDNEIQNAIRNGGGTRDSAAQTLDTILASGAIKDPNQALKLLAPTVMSATSANADATDFAMVGAKGAQSFGLDPSRIQDAYDAMIGGGQAGSFEAKDQAKYLPSQMAFAKNSGMSGIADFRKLIAYNQAAATTAGNSDEAGNNMANLLAKIGSETTAKDVKKSLGINLTKYLAEQKNKGVDSVEAFAQLIDKSVSKNKGYQQLKQKLASSKSDPERQATLASMVDIVQGSAVGQVIQDMQAMKAAVGIMNSRKNGYLDEVSSKTNSIGTAKDNFSLISETASFKTSQAGNEKEIAMQRAMDKLTPSIGSLSDMVVSAAREYPALTAGTIAATTALTALAAAGLAAAGTGLLTGGKGSAIKSAATGIINKIKPIGASAFGLGAMPLAAMYGMSEWAGNTSQDKQRSSALLGFSSGIDNFFGSDPNKAQREWRARKDQELNGTLTVKVDADGRVTGTSLKTNQAGIKTIMANGPHFTH